MRIEYDVTVAKVDNGFILEYHNKFTTPAHLKKEFEIHANFSEAVRSMDEYFNQLAGGEDDTTISEGEGESVCEDSKGIDAEAFSRA